MLWLICVCVVMQRLADSYVCQTKRSIFTSLIVSPSSVFFGFHAEQISCLCFSKKVLMRKQESDGDNKWSCELYKSCRGRPPARCDVKKYAQHYAFIKAIFITIEACGPEIGSASAENTSLITKRLPAFGMRRDRNRTNRLVSDLNSRVELHVWWISQSKRNSPRDTYAELILSKYHCWFT